MESRVHRFKALQDLLAALVPKTGAPTPAEGIPISSVSETALAGLSVLLPDSVIQQALHIVDSKGISRTTCTEGSWTRSIYEVKGQKCSHLVLANGLYCSCPYFARRVLEAGELCCKHCLAVQIARQCGMGIATTTLMQADEFVEIGRAHV